MNKKQYNNVIDWTIKHESAAQTEDSLATARAVFNNMGVALPNGTMEEVYETIKTDKYMGWKSCTMQQAQAAADKGTAAIGISKDRIVVLSATDEEQPVAQTASVMTLDETTSVYAVDGLGFYSYSSGTTNFDGGCNSQNSLYFAGSSLSVSVGWRGYNQLYGNTLSDICWTSSDTNVASVDYYSGYITARNAGIATITAKCALDSCDCATFEIWVKGKTPVFLIHGRTSHSEGTWGIKTNIPEGQNNHFNSSVDAKSLNCKKYTAVTTQHITDFLPNPGGTEKPYHLGNKLKEAGYKENINLFVFNYPNKDAVVHSAEKFKEYIKNLIGYVREFGTDEMKACFYASRSDYDAENHKINLVGHSMGGLVSRYYIENMGCDIHNNLHKNDCHVDKLITICTPHWGSGYADLSNVTAIQHVLCDHDLDFDSTMFGGNDENEFRFDENGCQISNDSKKCINHYYELSSELQYSQSRETKYYAIAGIDYEIDSKNENDCLVEIPVGLSTYQQITDYMTSKGFYKVQTLPRPIILTINPKGVGDNMVGFMSQIGWTEENGESPDKRISFEKICVDVDTDGGNGGGTFIWEVAVGYGAHILHNKVNHRAPVCDKVIEYLEE